jgi:predicted phosphodiesterase
LPPRPADFIRVVVISDTHERHRQVVVPPGDVLLHCGDILMSSRLDPQRRGVRVLKDFNSWLETVPCTEKVVIGGNHDVALERLSGERGREVLSAATWLQDSSATIAGLRIYGNSYSEGSSHNTAWQAESFQVSEEACDSADIVMTHHCTAGMHALLRERVRPTIWASGHEHKSHGTRFQDGTLFVNASIQRRRYNQPPVVVDLPRPEA